jgi:hypothetical protein
MPRGSRGDAALRSVDYVMFHTNGQTPEDVHTTIAAMRRWTGYDRPLIINEDGVSTFNLQAAAQSTSEGLLRQRTRELSGRFSESAGELADQFAGEMAVLRAGGAPDRFACAADAEI